MLLPIKSSKKLTIQDKNQIVLAGDVGATKTNLGLFKSKDNILIPIAEKEFVSKEYNNITEIIAIFLQEAPVPDSICFGVAGPVMNGQAKLSNILWDIDSRQLARHFKIKKVKLLNDLEANAYGLAALNQKDVADVHSVKNIEQGNAALISPGTGLGEAGMYWDGEYYHPFATEGGHCDFAPRNEFDFELYNFLKKKFGHVSWERLICGPGIVNIYTFLRDKKKRKEPEWLMKKMKEGDAAAIISQHVDKSAICKETMEHFIRYLAYESANIVLKFKATGGLFIGGGIAPKITSLFTSNHFYDSFCQGGRLNYLLKKVPIKIILNAQTALLGAAWYGIKN
ncbi:MAG: glucokinase [Bacteroidota bacterium]|nr:glucokinase [Bacteroidota bacterium]